MDKVLCGAKARSVEGAPCKLPPMENGRCRFHGGKTPIKHGKYSKKAILEKKALRAYLREYLSFINNL